MSAIDRVHALRKAFQVGAGPLGFGDVIFQLSARRETGAAPFNVGESELMLRRRRNRDLLEIAEADIKWIAAGMAGIPHVIHLADRDGVVLRSIASVPDTTAIDAPELKFESASAALSTDPVVSRIGDDADYSNWTFTAAPIHGAGGERIGSIHAGAPAASDNPERVVLVAYAAHTIERELGGRLSRKAEASAHGGEDARDVMPPEHRRETMVRNREAALAMVAHETRTPLNALRIQLEVLIESTRQREDLPAGYADWIRKRAQAAIASAERISRLVSDFTDVSLASEGKLRIERGDVDLVALIREAIRRAQALEPECPPVTLNAPDKIPGNWDRMRIDQVIGNLVANAVRHSRGLPIEVIAQADDACARIEVRDRGAGIAPDRTERIFEAFETSAGADVGHFGLGLWIVKRILDAMGGRISVASALGEGSSFVVELPRK